MSERSLRSADVAKAAGVSRATVSYVLNDRRDVRVSDATRQHVLGVAQRLGYIGSPAARALRSGRGDVVLLLVPEWEVAGQLALLFEDIGQLIAQDGLVCLRYEGPHWQGSLDRLLGQVSAACVVTFDPLGEHDAQALGSAGVPEVRAWLLDNPGRPHTTAIDQATIVQAQVDHLLEQGYQRLAYLAIEEPHGRPFTDSRITAFQHICSTRGITDAPTALVDCEIAAITPVLQSWIRQSTEPLGLVAWNDLTALGVVSAATSLGYRIPHDFGVIGGDDTPVARLAHPPLSTVRFNLPSEARAIAAHIATAVGHHANQDTSNDTPVHVVPRESTARLR